MTIRSKPEVERNVDYASISGLTVLRRHDDIQFVLKSSDFVPLKGDVPEIGRPFNRGSLLAISGEEHLARRRMYSPLFSNESLIYLYQHAAQPLIVDTLLRLRAESTGPGLPAADLIKLIPAMLYRVSAQVSGIDGIDTKEEAAEFERIISRFARGISIEFFEDPEMFVDDCLAGKEEVRTKYLRPCLARRRALVGSYRAGEIEKSDLPRDVLTLWLLSDDNLVLEGDSSEIEELMLVDLALFLYTASRTTMRLLPHVVQSITEWLEAHPEDTSKTIESAFLRGAISETLRLHGLPALQRRATIAIVLPSGAAIEPGEMVALDYVDANRDPNVYGDDAERWDPYRIERLSGAPWGLSFGGGPHTCIGRRLVTGGDWRRNSDASDRHVDGTLVAIMRALFEAGVRPDSERKAMSHGAAHASEFDEYLSYPVIFTDLEKFASNHSAGASTS